VEIGVIGNPCSFQSWFLWSSEAWVVLLVCCEFFLAEEAAAVLNLV
jgi:hypothetical protein